MTKIVILGGGISGLSAAYYLAKNLVARGVTHQITLLEKNKLGGWMQTEKRGEGIFELGPRSVRVDRFLGLNSLKLAEEVGLEKEILPITKNTPNVKNRFIYANDELNPLPMTIRQFMKVNPPLPRSIASVYFSGFLKEAPQEAETIFDVISGRFGEDIVNWYVDPFVRGVFAADSKELSLKAAFPAFWYMLKNRKAKMPRKPKLEEKYIVVGEQNSSKFLNQVVHEKWSQWNLNGGLTQFVDALEQVCLEKGVRILKSTEAERLVLCDDKKLNIECRSLDMETGAESHEIMESVDHVVSTVPSHSLSKILLNESSEPSPHQETLNEVGQKLEEIKFVDVGMVNLEFEGPARHVLPAQGFGHLVPSCVESKVLGIVYDSCIYPSHDRPGDHPTTRMTCMMGGSWFNDVFGDPEHVKNHDLEQAALESVSEQLGIKDEPLTAITNLHRNCIPTYRVGHTDLVENIEDLLEEDDIPLYLGGMSYWGVSVNECIYNSRYIAEKILKTFVAK